MIPGVPSMGGAELLILLTIVLLLFGAKRVPELGRSLGRGITEFRRGASEEADSSNELLRLSKADLPRPKSWGLSEAPALWPSEFPRRRIRGRYAESLRIPSVRTGG